MKKITTLMMMFAILALTFISAGKPENGNCISLKIQVSDTGYDAL